MSDTVWKILKIIIAVFLLVIGVKVLMASINTLFKIAVIIIAVVLLIWLFDGMSGGKRNTDRY